MNDARKIDVAGTGFTVLDRVYLDDEKAFETLGGSCANVLWSLAMLDRQVVPVLSLGTDKVGKNLVREFEHAGADTRYISRHDDLSSPVLVQRTDTHSGTHSFSFICPETDAEFPRYQPIDEANLAAAEEVIRSCIVFYVDRLSDAIVAAMEVAAEAAGIVYFEPSTIGNYKLFERAIACTSILKFSNDRLGHELLPILADRDIVSIVTYGSKGLEVNRDNHHVWCEAVPVRDVRDTSGSGDMVSVGLINCLIDSCQTPNTLDMSVILSGVRAGQRLAAANCAFVGARGLFQHCGPVTAKGILDNNVW